MQCDWLLKIVFGLWPGLQVNSLCQSARGQTDLKVNSGDVECDYAAEPADKTSDSGTSEMA